MSLYDDHIAYVTEVIREWFDTDHRTEIAQWIAEARRYYTEPQFEAWEWLANKMRDFALISLTAVKHEASRKLLNDSLSEVEWYTLADEYWDEAS